MPSLLRQVLNTFEDQQRPMSITQMAANLNIEPSALEGMIAHWVRKGKLREINLDDTQACASCGTQDGCPFIMTMPRTYELIREGDTFPENPSPPCSCSI